MLLFLQSSAQLVLKGRVLNETTNSPIPNASIYFNNTSVGTSSDVMGNFLLPTTAIGKGDIIISCVGFETLIFNLDEEVTDKVFVFKLSLRAAQLEEVLILPEALRLKYLGIFKTNFLGLTQEGRESSIKNLKDIYFVSGSEGKESFAAKCDLPIIVNNTRLGYTIYFQLVEFSFNAATGSTAFYGYTRYDEKPQNNKYNKRRESIYYGSTLHFFRALRGDSLQKEGYDLLLTRQDTNKATKNIMTIGAPTTAAMLVKTDSLREKYIFLPMGHQLSVTYKRAYAPVQYLSTAKGFIQGYLRTGYKAGLKATNPQIYVDENGILTDPYNVFFSGFWIYEKVANMLPYNYFPTQ